MCKAVIMIVDSGEDLTEMTYSFNTTGEAMEYAESLRGKERFDIYTLFKTGTLGGIQWKLSADTASNLRDIARKETIKKTPRTYKAWTDRETDIAAQAYKNGLSVSAVALRLSRPYKSVHSKLNKLGLIEKKADDQQA